MKLGFAIVAAAFLQAAALDAPPPLAVVELAPGVHEIPSVRVPDRGPDGNTIIFEAPEGLIVVDTGRHLWQSDAILAFARAQGRPIAAIINTHWHLDHASGNARLKAAFPYARVYTTNAVERALAEGGFLERDQRNIPAYLASPDLNDTQKDDVRIFQDTWNQRDFLRPDVIVAHSGAMQIAGRELDIRVTDRAVTDADIWIFDAASGIIVLGDLVTMPVPYFETACPQHWRAALDQVMMTPFTRAVPGHGDVMTRDQFNTYRTAFGAFVDCVNSPAPASSCGTLWSERIEVLINDPERLPRIARNAEYYVGYLREHGGKSRDCLAR
ncbi:MAG: MBL fold metallo-hydrolase [Hyphomonadaceae bacterium]|nr:MBL fold metallo-hydrolase [Hyphomonadaceae bacterium]